MKKTFLTLLGLLACVILTIPNFFAGGPCGRRRVFSPEEDQKLIELVNQYGTSDWGKIASLMEDRNPRQCRERWKHYLCVGEARKEPFSPEEDKKIAEMVDILGPKWTRIAALLPKRTDLDVKSRFQNFIRNQRGVRHSQVTHSTCENLVQIDDFDLMQLWTNEFGMPLFPGDNFDINWEF